MQADSRQVTSNQRFVHPRLGDIVQRHLRAPSRKPVATHNRQAFAALEERLAQAPAPLVLDSFCGTGQSSALLARRYPGHLVVGIDKSGSRLQRHPGAEVDNYLLLRAECEDIWALVVERGWPVAHHFLLYPNPWPKAAQLQRRVHGHPALPRLLALGGTVELRSNWQTYAEEFGSALHIAGVRGRVDRVTDDEETITLFEAKYRASGHRLWRYRARLTAPEP